MAVIVNDMGEINLDAEEIKTSRVIQEDAEMVEMHNGCICCTLRGDLLKTVKSLSQENKYDYLVIESTGIGEPLPVAQTFSMDVDSMEQTGHHHQYDHSHGHGTSDGETNPLVKSLTNNNGSEDGEASHKDHEHVLKVAQDERKSLSHFATLDTLVTVIDALNIFDVLGSMDTLASKNNVAGMNGLTGAVEKASKRRKVSASESNGNDTETTLEESSEDGNSSSTNNADDDEFDGDEIVEESSEEIDDRSVAKLLLDQIEFANVIVVSKANLLLKQQQKRKEEEKHNEKKDGGLEDIDGLLRKLNPGAKILIPRSDKYGDLDVSKELIHTGLFDMEKASQSAGWIQELMKPEHTPETEEYGISSVLFKAKRMPFHPERLFRILNGFGSYGMAIRGTAADDEEDEEEQRGVFRGVVRAKGQLWLANANAYPCDFQTAGKNVQINPNEESFLAALPKNQWDEVDQELYDELVEKNDWDERYGDRRSLLVFIGIGLNKALIHEKLKEALLTEEESKALGGVSGWKNLEDPFFDGQSKFYHEVEDSIGSTCLQ